MPQEQERAGSVPGSFQGREPAPAVPPRLTRKRAHSTDPLVEVPVCGLPAAPARYRGLRIPYWDGFVSVQVTADGVNRTRRQHEGSSSRRSPSLHVDPCVHASPSSRGMRLASQCTISGRRIKPREQAPDGDHPYHDTLKTIGWDLVTIRLLVCVSFGADYPMTHENCSVHDGRPAAERFVEDEIAPPYARRSHDHAYISGDQGRLHRPARDDCQRDDSRSRNRRNQQQKAR